jgi:hypothetical protein
MTAAVCAASGMADRSAATPPLPARPCPERVVDGPHGHCHVGQGGTGVQPHIHAEPFHHVVRFYAPNCGRNKARLSSLTPWTPVHQQAGNARST